MRVLKRKAVLEDKMSKLKNIIAKYDEKNIIVYQAYNNQIADEAVKKGTFGESFRLDRMSWIKPSFLWMMYRSGWGTKDGQERTLAIEISREGFNEIISQAVLSKYEPDIYETTKEWKYKLKSSGVRCQWDPERNIHGNPIDRRAIQLGLRGIMLRKYVNEYIGKINDVSEKVSMWREQIKEGNFDISLLPKEEIYPVSDEIKNRLGM